MSESDEATGSAESAELPPLTMLLRPRYLWSSITEFAVGWWSTRSLATLGVAVPAAIALLIAAVCVGKLSMDAPNRGLAALEARLRRAVEDKDQRAMRVCLNAMVDRAPNEPMLRLNLARLYADQGNVETARAVVAKATKRHPRFIQGHLWLAEIAKQSGAGPEQFAEAAQSYRKILESQPDHAVANAGLGEAYLVQKQPLLAQPLLRRAMSEVPEAGLLLARALLRSGKTKEAHQVAAQTAKRFNALLAKDSGNVSKRLRWVEALLLSNRRDAAQQVLREGLAISDAPEFRRALSDLVVMSTQDDIARGIATGDRHKALVVQAFHVAPENPRAIGSLCSLASVQFVECDPAALSKAVKTIEARLPGNSPLDFTLLGWLRYLQKDNDASLVAMQKAAACGDSDQQLELARLYSAIGESGSAEETSRKAQEHARAKFQESGMFRNALELVRTQVFAKQWDDALAVLKPFEEKEARAKGIIRSVRLRQFDHAMGGDGLLPERVIELAQTLCQAGQEGDPQVISRLGSVASRDDAAGKWAGETMREILALGVRPGLIHALLGTNALTAERFDEASRHLEFSFRVAPDDPVVCNNLAFALTMRSEPDHSRAYKVASRSLQQLPRHPDVLETRGRALLGLRRFEEALSDLQLALSQSTNAAEVHRLLAEAYDGLGDERMAKRHRELSEPENQSASEGNGSV